MSSDLVSYYRSDPTLYPGADWLQEWRGSQTYNRNSLKVGIPINLDTSYYQYTIPSGTPINDVGGVGTILRADEIAISDRLHGLLVYDILDHAGEAYQGSYQKAAVIETKLPGVTNQRWPAFPRVGIILDKLPQYDIWGTAFNMVEFAAALEGLGFIVQQSVSP